MKRCTALLLLLLCPLLAACGDFKLWGGPSADLSVVSSKDGATLRPKFSTTVYRAADESTIDIYLTDLPMARLADGTDKLEGLAGSVVHVSLFLQPSAGKTPIDPTACSGALRQLVVADGAMGMYAGGGFITTGDPGKETISGTLRGGTVRLIRATKDFNDLLGPASMEGKFTARYDDAACRVLAQRLQDGSLGLPVIKLELK